MSQPPGPSPAWTVAARAAGRPPAAGRRYRRRRAARRRRRASEGRRRCGPAPGSAGRRCGRVRRAGRRRVPPGDRHGQVRHAAAARRRMLRVAPRRIDVRGPGHRPRGGTGASTSVVVARGRVRRPHGIDPGSPSGAHGPAGRQVGRHDRPHATPGPRRCRPGAGQAGGDRAAAGPGRRRRSGALPGRRRVGCATSSAVMSVAAPQRVRRRPPAPPGAPAPAARRARLGSRAGRVPPRVPAYGSGRGVPRGRTGRAL